MAKNGSLAFVAIFALGCAAGDGDETYGSGVDARGGDTVADTSSLDTTPGDSGADSSTPDGTTPDSTPGDAGGGDTSPDLGSVDTGPPDTTPLDTGPPDTTPLDTGTPDTTVDTGGDATSGGCGVTLHGPSEGTSCSAPIAVDMGLGCIQTISGDTCTKNSISSSCGSGEGQIVAVSVASGIKLYSLVVSTGFSLAVIPGSPPFCGGAGSCVGAGFSTGVSAGTTQYWFVQKTGGGCGTYQLKFSPT